MKFNIYNETNFTYPKDLMDKLESNKKLNSLYNKKNPAGLNIIITNNKSIKELNIEVFKRNNVTDVISLNSPDNKHIVGEIYISSQVVKENARKFSQEVQVEFARVVIHGILHLLGYDHKKSFLKSDEEMFDLQEKILLDIMS